MSEPGDRIEDDALREKYRRLRCLCCRHVQLEGVCGHHLISRGSWGPDHENNLIPLCVAHHNEIHKIGLNKFAKKYRIGITLINKGWEFLNGLWENFAVQRMKNGIQ